MRAGGPRTQSWPRFLKGQVLFLTRTREGWRGREVGEEAGGPEARALREESLPEGGLPDEAQLHRVVVDVWRQLAREGIGDR
jgi:hypothetical protein